MQHGQRLKPPLPGLWQGTKVTNLKPCIVRGLEMCLWPRPAYDWPDGNLLLGRHANKGCMDLQYKHTWSYLHLVSKRQELLLKSRQILLFLCPWVLTESRNDMHLNKRSWLSADHEDGMTACLDRNCWSYCHQKNCHNLMHTPLWLSWQVNAHKNDEHVLPSFNRRNFILAFSRTAL